MNGGKVGKGPTITPEEFDAMYGYRWDDRSTNRKRGRQRGEVEAVMECPPGREREYAETARQALLPYGIHIRFRFDDEEGM